MGELRVEHVIPLATRRLRSTSLTPAAEHARQNPEFVKMLLIQFDGLVADFNKLSIDDSNRHLLIASSKLKDKLPTDTALPTIGGEMYPEAEKGFFHSRWVKNFIKGLKVMNEKMQAGEGVRQAAPDIGLLDLDLTHPEVLLFHLAQTTPEPLILATLFHAYEETVLADHEISGASKWQKDEITDALIEMAIIYHQDGQIFQFLKNSPESGGLGWIDGYDHLSEELRRQAGCS